MVGPADPGTGANVVLYFPTLPSLCAVLRGKWDVRTMRAIEDLDVYIKVGTWLCTLGLVSKEGGHERAAAAQGVLSPPAGN